MGWTCLGLEETDEVCPDWERANRSPNYQDRCPRGFGCGFAHGAKEQLYHPAYFHSVPAGQRPKPPPTSAALQTWHSEPMSSDTQFRFRSISRKDWWSHFSRRSKNIFTLQTWHSEGA